MEAEEVKRMEKIFNVLGGQCKGRSGLVLQGADFVQDV